MKNPIKSVIALLIRLYFGYYFLNAGIGKFQTGFNGESVGGFLKGGLAQTAGAIAAAGKTGKANVTDTWGWLISHVFLPNADIMAFMVKTGEVMIGLGLILGCFTTLAAFFALTMNFSFLLSGTVSSNPQMVIGFLVILYFAAASGAIGVDRFFMNKLVDKFPILNKGFLRHLFPVDAGHRTTINKGINQAG
ncbi:MULTISPECIES: DoxX family membrane protein [Desulfitobacterium]|uniref:DoxX protein n=1 Tax=Desulfitobacterium dehalogenans (strain ATCC 51507 / DSM 9161 / JW/IU-DC1) TaxID=756499 RepID=I4A6Y1_DESDJ|nr:MULTISPECIES: DoxX family membrane protein [Desulfitobacterium]AFL99715.1 DoxX protein [Desulfitobacterium dehalogenans ATCC 51507]